MNALVGSKYITMSGGFAAAVPWWISALSVLMGALAGCSGNTASYTDKNPRSVPPWQLFAPGTRAYLSGSHPSPSDQPIMQTVRICSDVFKFRQESWQEPCVDHQVGSIVTILKIDDDDKAVEVRGNGWEGYVGKLDIEPIIPAGIRLRCQNPEGFGLSLSGGGSFSVEDRTIEVVVSHSLRPTEMFGLPVTITRGFGVGKSGYIGYDAADCEPLNLPPGVNSLHFYEGDGREFSDVYL